MQGQRVIWSHDMESDESLSTSVVLALATAAKEDALDLDSPLADVLDPDALDALFTPLIGADETASVSFEYEEAAVTVRSDGIIEITQA